MNAGHAHRRLRERGQAFAQRLDETDAAKRRVVVAMHRLRPSWLIAGGLVAGLALGGLSRRRLAATVGALANVALRLLDTPLGSMLVGAVAARRRNRAGHEQQAGDRGGH